MRVQREVWDVPGLVWKWEDDDAEGDAEGWVDVLGEERPSIL